MADPPSIVEYGVRSGQSGFGPLDGAAANNPERAKRHWIDRAIPLEIAEDAPTEGMRGARFGSARGVAALWWRTRADRRQFWRQRRRIVLDHRPQRRRQDLDRQLHLGPLPADRRPIVLSWPRHHRAQSERAAQARHRPHLSESGAVSSYERTRQHHGRAASSFEK